MRRRIGFTLIELVIVVMVIGILVAIAAPKFINITADASDNSARMSLSVLRDAIETYASQNGGAYPADKPGIEQYLKGPFPSCPVGAAPADALNINAADPLLSDNLGGWMYNTTTGEIIINCTDASKSGPTYDTF